MVDNRAFSTPKFNHSLYVFQLLVSRKLRMTPTEIAEYGLTHPHAKELMSSDEDSVSHSPSFRSPALTQFLHKVCTLL